MDTAHSPAVDIVKFGMPEEELDRAKVLGSTVDYSLVDNIGYNTGIDDNGLS